LLKWRIPSIPGQSYLPLPQKVIAADVAGPDLSKEAIWLLAGLLLCALMIIGCACCSLRLFASAISCAETSMAFFTIIQPHQTATAATNRIGRGGRFTWASTENI
jgi:hypothetical protein